MANNFITNQDITYECLRVLVNNLKAVTNMNRDHEKDFANKKHQIGETLSIRRPPRYNGRLGQAASIEPMTDSFVPLTVNIQRGFDLQEASIDRALNIEDFSRRYIMPGVAMLANQIDFDALTFMKNTIANQVGTPGTTPNSLLTYFQARQKLTEMATPETDRTLLVNPAMSTAFAGATTTLFNPQAVVSKLYKTGIMQPLAGFETYEDQNVITHIVGTYGGTPTVNGAGQTGSSLVTQAWSAASTLNQGDVFTIAGVYAVNPQNRASTNSLQQFLVTAPVVASGGGALTIPIYPPIQPTGQFQNVTASPANAAAITVSGASGVSTPQGIGFHRDAFTAAFIDLEVPKGGVVDGYMQRDSDTGVSMRTLTQYNAVTDQWITRTDAVYGFAATYPELGVRIAA